MERNVKFLMSGKMVSGELVAINSKAVQVRVLPYGKTFTRRFDRHNVTIAPEGVEYAEDLEKLPAWYISYQKFLEAKRSSLVSRVVPQESADVKKQIGQILLARNEIARKTCRFCEAAGLAIAGSHVHI